MNTCAHFVCNQVRGRKELGNNTCTAATRGSGSSIHGRPLRRSNGRIVVWSSSFVRNGFAKMFKTHHKVPPLHGGATAMRSLRHLNARVDVPTAPRLERSMTPAPSGASYNCGEHGRCGRNLNMSYLYANVPHLQGISTDWPVYTATTRTACQGATVILNTPTLCALCASCVAQMRR